MQFQVVISDTTIAAADDDFSYGPNEKTPLNVRTTTG